jgi:hypothetical protein
MNTSQLKRFAQEARLKLLEQVAAKLNFVKSADTSQLRGKSETLNKLNSEIRKWGEEGVIDKVAYTWFNRLVALRYMDANGYQPFGMSVVSPATPAQVSPEILSEAHRGHIFTGSRVSKEEVMNILNGSQPTNNPDNEVYRLLLVSACNHLSQLFPFLFERIDDYTELLLPDDLTSPFSIVTDIYKGMSDQDCQEVEIIGWLYQFYISERKDEVFAAKKAVEKEDIPAATQLFTPRWIVEYMVQNTVGKLWLQNRPNSKIKELMPYYIESPSAKADDYLKLESVEDIKLLDPACGSGHILVYGFELLYRIYEEEGYSPNEIPALIIEKNLYGLEIDERASQLAGFALMMKARSMHRRFFRKEVKPNIACFQDLRVTAEEYEQLFAELKIPLPDTLSEDLELMRQATNFGSLIQPETSLTELIRIKEQLEGATSTAGVFSRQTIDELSEAVKQLIALSRKYHCVAANPPYMGGGNMNSELSSFVKKNYPDSKTDLMACFMESGLHSLKEKGYLGMINQHSWMFLSSYEKLRVKLIDNVQFDTLLHLGPRTFPEIGGEVVQNASFTFWKTGVTSKGNYIRLVDFGDSDLKRTKTLEAIQHPDCGWFYTANQKNFEKIPGSPIGYWLDSDLIDKISNSKKLISYGKATKGLDTCDNDRFVRMWNEVSILNFSSNKNKHKKWFVYQKGGSFRRWFGNNEKVVNWDNDGFEIKNLRDDLGKVRSRPQNLIRYFTKGITWSAIGSGKTSYRLLENSIFGGGGNGLFPKSVDNSYLMALLNSKITSLFLKLYNPTLNNLTGDLHKIPVMFDQDTTYNVKTITEENIQISKTDWDARETSWNFKQNELVRLKSGSLQETYECYTDYWSEQFYQLHENEEELNRQFIEIYGLEEELTPDVPLEEITILQEESVIEDGELQFKMNEVMAQFVSYAVGCMFGRYSLDKEGLILANQGETLKDYLDKVEKTKEEVGFLPVEDNVIPVLDEEWFFDDITERFHDFLRASFGEENFRENVEFVEESLGKDIRRYFTRDFYNDHVKRYKKRPIYWMFSSPKGYFNVLIYMHRYTPDTINRILNAYLREFIDKLERHSKLQEEMVAKGSAVEQNRARKEIRKIDLMLDDCKEYEKEILYPLATQRVSFDLDDGVLVNYNKMGSAVANVSGLNDKAAKKKVRKFDWIDTSEIRD